MRSAELGLALALDATLGEPPAHAHPVVWMGRLIDGLELRLPEADAPYAAVGGALAAGLGAAVVVALARVLARAPWPLRGLALWGLLSGRLLLREVTAVEEALTTGGVTAGRARVAWLVSRETDGLTEAEVRAAAVQSLAENTTDAFVATLWWWTLAGLPGAALHRWFDTLDSRWGYRDATWRDRGRAAARADDVLAWGPARLVGLLWHARIDTTLRREAARTPSPNGGWSMGAAALALDTRLTKPGAYTLHPGGREPDATTVPAAHGDARRVLATAAGLSLCVAALSDRRTAGGGRP